MVLVELAQDIGLDLRKTSNSRGGEYHSSCPACGEGVDRFAIWPVLNRFWCRRCGISGDSIQFCRNFLKMSFREACNRTNENPRDARSWEYNRSVRANFIVAVEPSKIWQEKALAFTEWSHKQLQQSPIALEALGKRGINESTVNQFKLGYSSYPFIKDSGDLYRDREDWGLPHEYKEDGKLKTLWLPSGLVIPTMSDGGSVFKLKIRRQLWHKDDPLPKYIEVPGSMQCLSVYGNTSNKVAMVVESELDALLIQQTAKDICFCIALGGVTKKPDSNSNHLLSEAKLVLCCLDNDEAGRNAALWWRNSYSHLKFWPAPVGKSPGDAFKDHGINLRDWILKGIEFYLKGNSGLKAN